MRKALLAVLGLGLGLAAMSVPTNAAAAPDEVKMRRFALIIGSNDGGSDRVKLRFATTDARAVAKVVADLGGVATRDVTLLLDPTRSDLARTFDSLKSDLQKARAADLRLELLIYYSGHSDESGILLYGKRYSYPELREAIRAMPSDVNIAILDSCASGSFTRLKGGTRRPAFLVDESSKVRGYAFLSSSSADEAAQESDRIGASFFTHYLVSGLRGGADTNRDGRVTLSEVYQFAFSETVARTETTQAGAQHPAYDMHLVGSGDVVMTDLRATSAALVVGKMVNGRLFIRDAHGRLVVEINKPAGRSVVLGLGPERYEVTLQQGDRLFKASVALERGKRTRLTADQFAAVEGEATVSRGTTGRRDAAEPKLARVPFSLSFLPAIGTSTDAHTLKHVSINILAGRTGKLQGVEIGGLANIVSGDVEGAQLAGLTNVVGGRIEGIQVAGLANLGRREVNGAQLAGLANRSGAFEGIQVAGIANHARGDVTGVQLSGIANVSEGRVKGAQVALVNVGGQVEGAQIGLVNVARRIEGVQIGLVNVADQHDGAPIGLINAVRDGHRALEVWTSDTAPLNVGFKLGSRHWYAMLAVGSDDELFYHGAGVGVHIPRRTHYVDIDLMGWGMLGHDFDPRDHEFLGKLRVGVGWPMKDGFALFAGASLSAAFAFAEGREAPDFTFIRSRTYCGDSVAIRFWPGLFAGISY